MDLMDEGLLEFWRGLNSHAVKYIMVGGFAVNMNGYIRATKDSDLWLMDTTDNRKRLRAAFNALGYGDFPSFETGEIAAGWTQYYVANGIILDIMTSMKGLEDLSFEDCFKMANKADLEGVIVPFLHINHLIDNKKAVNRPRDQMDVIELEKIKKYLEEKSKQKGQE
jgi:hypothetical protein